MLIWHIAGTRSGSAPDIAAAILCFGVNARVLARQDSPARGRGQAAAGLQRDGGGL